MISTQALENQFNRAVRLGWLKELQAIETDLWAQAKILAIASRETNLNPKYLSVPGDNGNGYGLTQADIHSYPDFVKSGAWKTAKGCFEFTQQVLKKSQEHFVELQKKSISYATTRDGRRIPYKPVPITKAQILEQVIIAAYNCGDWAYYHFCVGNDIDRGTTPGPSGKPDYSIDTLGRASWFHKMLRNITRAKDASEISPAVVVATAPPAPTTPNQAQPGSIPAEPKNDQAVETEQAWSFEKVKTTVSSVQGKAEEVTQTVESVSSFVGKRADTIKALRVTVGMKILGALTIIVGWLKDNQTEIYIGLLVIVLFALLYFGRQWHLGAIRERKQ